MKKLMFLMMALMVAPAMAAVDFSIVDNGDTTADLVVTVTGGDLNGNADSKVAGIALDVTISSGNITLVDNYMTTGESVDGAEGYGIFMGTITFTGNPSEIDTVGTPVAPAGAPDNPGQVPGDEITLEFGCLYDVSVPAGAPLAVTTLCTFTVDGDGLTITLTADDTRNGVVLIGGGPAIVTNLPYTSPVITGFIEDFGDAPNAPYPTLLANNGARHTIGGPFLGPAGDEPDTETDGQPNANATGDDGDGNDDENGVTLVPLIIGTATPITFEVNGGGGDVSAWVDFNADGDWQDSGENILNGVTYGNGVQVVNVTAPAGSAGTTYVRFRITSSGALATTGLAPDGEVEDHEVVIEEPAPAECMKNTHPDYAEWVSVGSPDCWCYRKQAYGDADGTSEGNFITGYKPVYNLDLPIFIAAYDQVILPEGGICADFAHDEEGNFITGYKRVYNNDLPIFVAYYDDLEATVPESNPDWFNFFTN